MLVAPSPKSQLEYISLETEIGFGSDEPTFENVIFVRVGAVVCNESTMS